MKAADRLTDNEYEALSLEYELNPPELSGVAGFLTNIRERALVAKLLPPDYARVVNTKANIMALSPSEIIQYAIRVQLLESDGILV